jgi:SAM-dependent methyltransferase
MSTLIEGKKSEWDSIKARQKATWESGDFGQIARIIVPMAEEFMSHLPLRRGLRVLDVACGTGNLAVIAARVGCITSGVDIASNLIAQARERANQENLSIDYTEGDAEALQYPDASFDLVVSMFGVMFAPRPDVIVRELLRVTKPGGLIALANWTPEGFVGKMFGVFKAHITPPAGIPSPLEWGSEPIVRQRFHSGASELRLTRRMGRMALPYDAAGTVEFFRRFYGPTHRAFASLPYEAQAVLRRDLEHLQAKHNVSTDLNMTATPSEYLEIHVRREKA